MNQNLNNLNLSQKDIKKINEAIKKVYNGDFIIYLPLKVRVVKGRVKKVKELKIELVQRDIC